ncbi:MAG: hypothetical protein ABSG78_22985 [Verrucomicrobiota bacterium]
MGEIKDVIDLITKLRDEIGNRKVAEVVDRIQPLLISFQSAQVSLMEKHTDLLTEKLKLTQKIAELEADVANLKRQQFAKPRRFSDGYQFFPSISLWAESGVSSPPFLCSKCFAKEIISPVQDGPHGWKCRTCGEYFADPQRPQPPSKPISFGPRIPRISGL